MKGRSHPEKPPSRETEYRFILFIAGDEPNSCTARQNLAAFCSSQLGNQCEVEVVDVLVEYARAAEESILVTPTLVIRSAGSSQVVIGNLSDRKKLQRVLGLGGTGHDRE